MSLFLVVPLLIQKGMKTTRLSKKSIIVSALVINTGKGQQRWKTFYYLAFPLEAFPLINCHRQLLRSLCYFPPSSLWSDNILQMPLKHHTRHITWDSGDISCPLNIVFYELASWKPKNSTLGGKKHSFLSEYGYSTGCPNLIWHRL